jgi:type I restriction enzyme R subunit
MHGLIQAFSRTNRILNSIKTFGNIVCFRNLEYQVNQAISIFGDKEAGGIVLLKSFDEYYNGYDKFKGYKHLVKELLDEYPIGIDIIGEKAEKAFIALFNQILKTRNILQSFDDFKGNEIISDFDHQNYTSIYLGIYEKVKRSKQGDAESIIDDIEFEIELVKSVEVNIDYILLLVAKYHQDNTQDKKVEINQAIDSSPSLRNKKDLILDFIESLRVDASITDEWKSYIDAKKQEELDKIILEEDLIPDETIKFINQAFKTGEIRESGTSIIKVMKPVSMFGKNNQGLSRSQKKQSVIQRLIEFFNRYFGL